MSDTSSPGAAGSGPGRNALLDAVGSNGRLRRLLDGLTTSGVRASAAIDPALVRALALAGSGRHQIGAVGAAGAYLRPADAAALAWLNDVRGAAGLDLIGLPYANADVAAILHAGQPQLAAAARARGAEVLPLGLGKSAVVGLTSGIAVPPSGYVDQGAARYYASRGAAGERAQALVLAADAVPPTGDNPSAAAAVPGVSERLLLGDSVLNQLVTAGPGANARLAEQEIIAELAESHLEDRFASRSPGTAATTRAATAQPLLIAPGDGWSPSARWFSRLLSDTSKLSWLRQVPVSDLLTGPAEPRAGLRYPAAARAAELPGYILDGSAQLMTATEGLLRTPRRGDPPSPRSPSNILQPIRDAALEAVSSSLRSDPAAAQTFLSSAQAAFGALKQQVRVVASPKVTLTSKSGKVPVTIENNLDAAVDVSLELNSLDRSRVSSGTTVTRTVRAGQKVQVEVAVRASGAGTFPVSLTLHTPSGESLGTPAQVLVRSTTYGVVATIFTAVALGVLGLAVLWRAAGALLRRSRSRRPVPSGSS